MASTTVNYQSQSLAAANIRPGEHISGRQHHWWTSHVTIRKCYKGKWSRERSMGQWRDELDKCWKDTIWLRIAQTEVEAACWRLHPATGNNGYTMMMVMVMHGPYGFLLVKTIDSITAKYTTWSYSCHIRSANVVSHDILNCVKPYHASTTTLWHL